MFGHFSGAAACPGRRGSAIVAALMAAMVTAQTYAAPATADYTVDVVVYDASSGGVTAAVAAARHGAKTLLVCASWPACWPEGGLRVGGMSSGGLGETDLGSCSDAIGGIAREFYTRNRQHYGNLSTAADLVRVGRVWPDCLAPPPHPPIDSCTASQHTTIHNHCSTIHGGIPFA